MPELSENPDAPPALMTAGDVPERALEESLRFMQFAFDRAADAMFWADPEKRFIYVNDAACLHLGYTREELLEMRVPDISVNHDPSRYAERWEILKRTHHVQYESMHRHKSGRLIPIEISLNLLEQEKKTFTCAIIRDISERVQANEEARQSQRRAQLLKTIAVAANETSNPDEALQIALDHICEYKGWPVGHVYVPSGDDKNELVSTQIWRCDNPKRFAAFRKITEETTHAPGVGLPGRVFSRRSPAWIIDVTRDKNFPRAECVDEIGVRGAFAFPVLVDQEIAAVLEFYSDQREVPDEAFLLTVAEIGIQLGIVIERKQAALDLAAAHDRLMETARRAGMAEVASSVLHNVGNVLNSVNVSATVVARSLRNLGVSDLAKAAELISNHTDNFESFVINDVRGKHFPEFIIQLSREMDRTSEGIFAEIDNLRKNLEHINDVISLQQSNAGFSSLIETQSLDDLVETAIRIVSASSSVFNEKIIREFDDLPPIAVDKQRLMQVLVNLISNAKHAIAANEDEEGRVTVKIVAADNRVRIEVVDNGVGIIKENLTRIFAYGFTTRKAGHGFGLHSSALMASEMDASLVAHSNGPGTGATFVLDLPLRTSISE